MENVNKKLEDLSITNSSLTKNTFGPYISWSSFFTEERSKHYYQKLMIDVEALYNDPDKKVYPGKGDIFRVFHTGPADVNVVILGQDPYHGAGQSNGLAFGVEKFMSIPPSLKNIFKESNQDGRTNGDLIGWADQGVLLLNTIFTVEEGKPKSHSGMGWEIFTNSLIKWLSTNAQHRILFVLWGADAFNKKSLVDITKHSILVTSYPSPVSANRTTKNFNPFIGSGIFDKINDKLSFENKINWKL